MKKTIYFFAFLLMGVLTNAQTNEGFNFKGLVANNGNPVANQMIDVKISIYQASTLKWREVHSNVQTDANGIFSVVMGEGTRISGVSNFSDINWHAGNMKYRVEVDTGSGYTTLVNNEKFKRVPYAKLAESIGQLNKLGVGEMPTQFETVRFKRSNPNDGEDVLDLEINAAPSSGRAQFIECNLGSNHGVFTVDHNGDIYTKGELHGNDSGTADMKAYAYGEWFMGSSRHTTPNVTITHLGTGRYKVTFGNSPGGTDKYIVVGNTYAMEGYVKFGKSSGYFNVNVYNSSGTHVDGNFTFVVFKK